MICLEARVDFKIARNNSTRNAFRIQAAKLSSNLDNTHELRMIRAAQRTGVAGYRPVRRPCALRTRRLQRAGLARTRPCTGGRRAGQSRRGAGARGAAG